jgi:hypothetical protein
MRVPVEARKGLRSLRWKHFWYAVFALGGVIDIWRALQGDESTLSDTIRFVFHTNSPEGKVSFLAALAVLGIHILFPKKKTPA